MNELSIEVINKLDEKSFHLIYKMYFRVLAGYALQITSDEEIALDIVQDLFSVIWERKMTFISPASFKAYLYNSVRNAALDYIRHRKVKNDYIENVKAENPEYDMDAEYPADYFYREEVYRHLFKAIDELPLRCREIFLLYIKGKKNSEIAESLHISVETVKTQKKRGLSILRKKLGKRSWLLLLVFVSLSA